jgi:hypothetical protein
VRHVGHVLFLSPGYGNAVEELGMAAVMEKRREEIGRKWKFH